MTQDDIKYELRRKLDDRSIRRVYKPSVAAVTDEQQRKHLRVAATIDEVTWEAVRRYDDRVAGAIRPTVAEFGVAPDRCGAGKPLLGQGRLRAGFPCY